MGEQRIKDWPTTQRPRERLLQFGPEQITDAELIAILVGHGVSGQSAVATARLLLKRFGSIRGILNASPPDLVKVRGMGASKTARLIAARECGCRNLQERMTPGKAIRCPDDSRRYLVARLRDGRTKFSAVCSWTTGIGC
jgi:DNA repair protein RadC